MSARRAALAIVAVLVLFRPAPARAQTAPEDSSERLLRMARETVKAIDEYLRDGSDVATYPAEMQRDVKAFREHAVGARDQLRRFSAIAAGQPNELGATRVFDARFRPDVRDDAFAKPSTLMDAVSQARRDRLMAIRDVIRGGRVMRCCDQLVETTATQPEFALADRLADIWQDYAKEWAKEAIARAERTRDRFVHKLLRGFPAMPWEYALNFQGDRNGPTSHQLIWLHPSAGFQVPAGSVAGGAARLESVLTIQALGYNRYFLDDRRLATRLNYVGVAALVTLSPTAGEPKLGYGGAVHVGNLMSLGSTYRNAGWNVFLASDRWSDALIGLFR